MSDVVSTIENLEKQRRQDHVQAMLWHEVGKGFFGRVGIVEMIKHEDGGVSESHGLTMLNEINCHPFLNAANVDSQCGRF
jgi:hypothetical protein